LAKHIIYRSTQAGCALARYSGEPLLHASAISEQDIRHQIRWRHAMAIRTSPVSQRYVLIKQVGDLDPWWFHGRRRRSRMLDFALQYQEDFGDGRGTDAAMLPLRFVEMGER